ncbi:MBL fold metallo-hydrolase [Sinisalibacter lacisalsi]|uniref:MBL fold hydrolase n=1 Tax=Sinisalibacter lacisalsi TaxID=1526570 RepID=A0ABQ1QJ00_9RHOB|nr:MBL fold metallo-hydrolase [Sinisalibacter lacisalsi]GGD29147.1 MBL fold hydrolase [Sinisalibacter lacisalsi]
MKDARPTPGVIQPLAPGIRLLLAPNPSPMTHWGTNTYVLGEGAVTVLDPGPAIRAHYDAILAGLAPGERVARVLVSHAHLDHSPLARPLAEATGARVQAFGPPEAGRSPVMADLAARGLAAGGEGVEHGFTPDVQLEDGETLDIGNGRRLETIWTPGHFAGHLSFALDEVIFTGDHVMGWASTLISPPDGDLTAFLASCHRLAARRARLFLPGHGAPVTDPAARLDWLVAHRKSREAEILAALAKGPATPDGLARAIYADTPAALLPAAARNVFAHLIDLTTREITRPRPKLAADASFERIGD